MMNTRGDNGRRYLICGLMIHGCCVGIEVHLYSVCTYFHTSNNEFLVHPLGANGAV